MIDFIVQALSAGLLFWGLWECGNQRRRGPLLACAAEAFTTAVGISHGVWGIVLIGVVLFVVQFRAFVLWTKRGLPL